MTRQPWSAKEIGYFLDLNAWGVPADGIACGLRIRTKAAVQGMRRKLKRLIELGVVERQELVKMLQVHEAVVLIGSLKEIRARSKVDLVPVKLFVRRGRVTGKPHLVSEHKRNIAAMSVEATP